MNLGPFDCLAPGVHSLPREIQDWHSVTVMTGEILFVLLVLLATICLFVSNRLRIDIVSLLALLALLLGGILTPEEALAGFSNPVVIIIAGLFVVGEALLRTGIAHSMGRWLIGVAGTSRTRLMALLMVVVAGFSAFLGPTGTIAIFIPVALNLATKAGLSASQLLLPMAYASLIGGMLTLIGTPPNLLVSSELGRAGLAPFAFFQFTPFGLAVLVVGIGFMLTIGQRLLPRKTDRQGAARDRLSLKDLAKAYGLMDHLHRLQISPESRLVGSTLAKAKVGSLYQVNVLGIEKSHRSNQQVRPAESTQDLEPGDILYILGEASSVDSFSASENLSELKVLTAQRHMMARELGLAEILLTPRSELNGRTLKGTRFRARRGLTVLGILRRGIPLKTSHRSWEKIDLLQRERRDFLLLNLPTEMEEVAPARQKAPWAIAILVAMMVLLTFRIVPNVAAVLSAALAAVLTRCVPIKRAYLSIDWKSLVMIAGMFSVGAALQKTGGIDLMVSKLISNWGDQSPILVLGGFFLLTSLLSQFISNTATAVLIAPIAMATAQTLGLSPYPFLMTIALAASTAFSTPVATPVNTLVLSPGDYKFLDFARLGIPLQILAMIVTLLLVPRVFPF
jgi:di/tricarboxylate transporter